MAELFKTIQDLTKEPFTELPKGNMLRLFVKNCCTSPERIAFIYESDNGEFEEFTYGDVANRVSIIANELILSGGENNGRYPITAYYLNNGNPGLLAESHVAGNGGSRMGFNLYSDGNILSSSWSSGTGRGIATLLNLSNGKFTKIKTANIDNIYDLNSKSGSPESMGLSKNLQINLNSLSWKPIKQ